LGLVPGVVSTWVILVHDGRVNPKIPYDELRIRTIREVTLAANLITGSSEATIARDFKRAIAFNLLAY
jgi:hypothetical protein